MTSRTKEATWRRSFDTIRAYLPRSCLSWACLTALVTAAAALPARASAEDARELFRRGESAYQQSNYELAIEQWEKAYALERRPRFQHNLALAYERLGRLEKAIDALKRFLESADPDDPAYGDASTRRTALEQRLLSTGIRITGGVEGARIRIDNREWGLLPRPDKIPVKPGSHSVVIRHKDYREFVSNVVVPAGQVVEVAVRLKPGTGTEGSATFFAQPDGEPPVAAATEVDAGDTEDKEEDAFFAGESPAAASSGGDPTAWYIASGAMAAGAVGGAIWTAERAGKLSDCGNTAVYYCANESTVRREQNAAALLTIALGAGAIASLVYGLTQESSGNPPEKKEEAGQEARTLHCGTTILGARCALRF